MRTGGEKTKKRILEVAEELFSEKGFDATSVGMIADTVGINKGLIYYHFKDKNDIIVSLLMSIIDELRQYVRPDPPTDDGRTGLGGVREKIKEEITFLEGRKNILSIMLMEAFKESDKNDFLFQCAEIISAQEAEGAVDRAHTDGTQAAQSQTDLVHEFFTGFIPMVVFIAMKDKWSRYYRCDPDTLLDLFVNSFEATHLASHIKKK